MAPYSCFHGEISLDEVINKKTLTLSRWELVKPNAAWIQYGSVQWSKISKFDFVLNIL